MTLRRLRRHGEWEKKSNFDLVVRVPLMIHVPSKPASWGVRTTAIAELVDVFPTIAVLAGLPPPAGKCPLLLGVFPRQVLND